MSEGEYVSVKISDRTTVGVSRFRGKTWYHIKQQKKDKSVSLAKDELKLLFGKKDKLIKASQKVEGKGKKGKKRSWEERDSEENGDQSSDLSED